MILPVLFFLRLFWLFGVFCVPMGFPGGSDDKKSACNTGDPSSSLGWEDLLEKGMATHYRVPVILPGKPHGQESLLQSMGSSRAGHDTLTNTLGFPGSTSGKEPAC